jgi:hypothetical protein
MCMRYSMKDRFSGLDLTITFKGPRKTSSSSSNTDFMLLGMRISMQLSRIRLFEIDSGRFI